MRVFWKSIELIMASPPEYPCNAGFVDANFQECLDQKQNDKHYYAYQRCGVIPLHGDFCLQ